MSSALISACVLPMPPAALPTQIRLASRRAMSSTARRHQPIVQNDIGVLQRPQRFQCQQFRIPWPGAHQRDLAGLLAAQLEVRANNCCAKLSRAMRVARRRNAARPRHPRCASKYRRRASVSRNRQRAARRRACSHNANSPNRFGMSASSRSRRRRASTGDVPPVEIATSTGIAIDDGGDDEARGFAVVDDVDRNSARFAQSSDPSIHGAPRGRDDDEPCAIKIVRNELAQHSR